MERRYGAGAGIRWKGGMARGQELAGREVWHGGKSWLEASRLEVCKTLVGAVHTAKDWHSLA